MDIRWEEGFQDGDGESSATTSDSQSGFWMWAQHQATFIFETNDSL